MNNAKLKPGQLVTHNGHTFRVKRLIFKCDQKCDTWWEEDHNLSQLKKGDGLRFVPEQKFEQGSKFERGLKCEPK